MEISKKTHYAFILTQASKNMLYLKHMNKDVISIAPEDDITDIIAKIKGSSQKIVALIPPQPAGILRSAVNIKLIAKVSEETGKVPVFVTSDPAILKLASAAHLPVAESLQSRPSVPTEEDLETLASTPEKEAEIAEEFVKPPRSVEEVIESSDVEKAVLSDDDEEADESEDDSSDADEKDESEKSAASADKKSKKSSKLVAKFPWLEGKKKLIIISASSLVVVVGFLVWALVFAPFVSISLSIRTSSNNFSESASFTTTESEEDSSAGKFFLREEKFESESKAEFAATGKKDIGNKATGSISISVYFSEEGTVSIPANTSFNYGGLNYLASSDAKISWDGEKSCENGDSIQIFRSEGCKQTGSVSIVAAEPSEKYNIDSGKRDWVSNFSNLPAVVKNTTVINTEAISGGTSKIVTVVQQSDVDTARGNFADMSESEGKEQLKEKISDTVMPIWSTYKSSVSDPVVSPKVGEVVEDGVTPTVTSTASFSVYTIDKVRIEEFINAKATLGSDQKIYSVGEPFIEYFNGSDGAYTGKLKTTYKVGPKVTESDVMEKASGKKIGEVQSILKSINGVNKVEINPSFFWVNSVPSDPNKISITVKVDED